MLYGKEWITFLSFLTINLEKNFELEMYDKALKLHGEVKYEDCYCFVPIIPIGGKKIENLKKGKAFTHIEVIVYLMGRVE